MAQLKAIRAEQFDLNERFEDFNTKNPDLTKLLDVIAPFAKSIKCLESSHSTAADVYLFWLAIMAHLEDLFRKTPYTLPNHVKEQIRAISNRRFDGMINHAPTDVYIAAFFLDPSKSNNIMTIINY